MNRPGPITLSAEQLAAIATPGNLLVRAGAGAGKTEVLARRFVVLAAGDIAGLDPLEPDQIAAITFTEKAALDMRRRIESALRERGLDEKDATRRAHWQRLLRRLPLARISTIHAFCARILRENAVAAGLDPNFEVLDDYTGATFFERIGTQAIVDAVRRGDAGARYLVRARRVRGGPFREGALEIIQRAYTEIRRRGHPPDWILKQTQAASARLAAAPDRVAALAHELANLIDRLCETRGVGGATGAKLKEFRELWPSVRQSVSNLDHSSAPATVTVLRTICAALPGARSKVSDSIKQIRTIVQEDKNRFGLSGELISAWGERRALAPACAVAHLIAQVGQAFETAKRVEQVLTFDDLLIATRDLFVEQPNVVERYRRELRALLIDEYQDTDGLQDTIVALLTDPRQHLPSPSPELFIVGDEKQSIYRFRGADVSVFRALRAPLTTQLALVENRRSTPNILRFVNGLGESAMRATAAPVPAYEIDWRPEHALQPVRLASFDYPVEVIVAIPDRSPTAPDNPSSGPPTPKLQATDRRRDEAIALVNRIGEIVASGEAIEDAGQQRAVAYRDVVVLFRAFSDIAIYERTFAAMGLPFYTVNGRGFYGRREVVDLVHLLAAVDDPRDSLALVAALRAPFFALSDDCLLDLGLHLHEHRGEQGPASFAELFAGARPDFAWMSTDRDRVERAWDVIEELRRLRDRAPLMSIIERALELTDYDTIMAGLEQGQQRLANLRKLIGIAHDFAAHRFLLFHDFVNYLRRLTEEEPYEPLAQTLSETDNVVRLMTVHQAKGLEFPIVIVADAGRGGNYESRTPLVDPAQGLLLCDTYGSGDDEIPNGALAAYRQRVREEEAAEAIRVMYVALTRARDRLVISEGANLQGWSKHLRAFLDETVVAEFTQGTIGATKALDRNNAQVLLRLPDVQIKPLAARAAKDAGISDDAVLPLLQRRLAPPIREAGELTVSPTALADFDRCPRQYWLRHGLGLPEGSGARGSSIDGSAAMGTVVHRVLEQLAFGGSARAADLGRIKHLTAALGREAGLTSAQNTLMERDLTRYLNSPAEAEVVVGREIPFMLNGAPGLFVRGQIDAVVRSHDGLLVRDYKYSSGREAQQYQVQMECYALATAAAFPHLPIRAQITALRGEPRTIAITLPAVPAMRARLAALGAALTEAQAHGDYPRKPANATACRALRCRYVARCWEH